MISNKYFSTLVLTLISFSAYAQFSLKVKDVNLVAYGDYKVELVCVKNNKFYEIGFDSDENDSISSITVSEDYYENSKENILKNRKEIKVEDITRIKINSFIQTKKYEVINKDQKQVFSLLNNQIAMLEYYQFENYYDNQKHKNVKDWNLTSTDFKSIYLLDIGLGKNIVVIGNNDGYIIPTSKKPIIQYQEINFTDAKIVEFDKENLVNNIQNFDVDKFYRINKESKNKYSLRNNFGKKIIEKTYDTIYMNKYFVVGKINSDIEIYNTILNKFDSKNVKAAYLKSENLKSIQILNGNELQDLSFLGNIKQIEEIIRRVCGNVTETHYNINKNMLSIKTSEYLLKQTEDTVIKIDLSTYFFDTIKFLNNKNEFIDNGYEFASDYIFNLSYKWLLVSKNGKFGIYEFNTDRKNSVALKEILPLEYDAIETLGYHSPLKLKKDNFFNYYGVNKKRYKRLYKYNYYFCRFEDEDGKSGWLYYKGNEYFD